MKTYSIAILISLLLLALNINAQNIEELNKKAEEGDVNAQYELADYYYNTKDFSKRDVQKAKVYYAKAAKQGHKEAQYMIGVLNVHFDATQEQFSMGVKWLKKAAEQGHVEAQYKLGSCYYFWGGINIDSIDTQKAKYWVKEAIKNGHERAKVFYDEWGLDKY